jgi:hypothetical protein
MEEKKVLVLFGEMEGFEGHVGVLGRDGGHLEKGSTWSRVPCPAW